jgi:hypothetical protein
MSKTTAANLTIPSYVADTYKVHEVIGEGAYGVVW